jgi:hypothetical protein
MLGQEALESRNTMLEAELQEVSWRNAMPGTLTLRCLLETQPACYLVSPPLYNADGVAHWYYGRNSTATIDKRAEGGGVGGGASKSQCRA